MEKVEAWIRIARRWTSGNPEPYRILATLSFSHKDPRATQPQLKKVGGAQPKQVPALQNGRQDEQDLQDGIMFILEILSLKLAFA